MTDAFYAPLYLLLSISDAADREKREEIAILFTTHIDCFIEKYATERP